MRINVPYPTVQASDIPLSARLRGLALNGRAPAVEAVLASIVPPVDFGWPAWKILQTVQLHHKLKALDVSEALPS